jgi:hypothetical protein
VSSDFACGGKVLLNHWFSFFRASRGNMKKEIKYRCS